MTGDSRGHKGEVTTAFRARFLLVLSLIHAAGALCLFLALFVVLSKPFPGDYAAVHTALRHLPGFLFPVIGISALVYALLVCMATAVLCVYKLHRIAGPLYRLGQAVESYLAGEDVMPAFFRDGDQVAGLASAFNGFIGRLREDRQRWLGKMEHAERLCFQDRATCRSEMEKALAELSVLLAKYR